MAPRTSPTMSVANQVRSKTLAVNMGGAQGRTSTVHKGVGINQAKGGLNSRGSGAKAGIQPVKPAAPKPVAKFPNAKTYKDAAGNVRQVGTGRVVTPAAATPAAAKPAAPVATVAQQSVVPDTSPLNYQHLSSYQSGMANVDLDGALGRDELQSQLASNAAAYKRATEDDNKSYERSIDSATNDLNHAGLLRSGAHEKSDASLYDEYSRHMEDINQQYGAGATLKINQALARLKQGEAQQRLAVEQGAMQEYDDIYQAAPQPEATTSEPAAAAPTAPRAVTNVAKTATASGYKSGTGEYLNVKQLQPDGKTYKTVAVHRSKLTPAQLANALKNGLN